MDITKIPEKILARRVAAVNIADLKNGGLSDLIAEMRAAMIANNGIGLAANQVGKDLQLFVIDKDIAAENSVPDAYVNPEIIEYSRESDDVEEGCLSIPGYYTPIRRAKKIWIKAYDEHGNRIKFRARGMLARIIQHETDHLNGTVIKDRAQEK